jgi:hypothetical protein
MSGVNDTLSQLMRSGALSGLGFGPPVKMLAAIDGQDIQKDFSMRTDICTWETLRNMIQDALPTVSSKDYYYSYTYIADEALAYRLHMQRLKGDFSDQLHDCLVCESTPKKLLKCGRCRQVVYCSVVCQTKHWNNKPWGHKKACKRMQEKPRRKLDDYPDTTPLKDLGVDGNGMIIVDRVKKAEK